MELSRRRRRFYALHCHFLMFSSAFLAAAICAPPAQAGWNGLTRIITDASGITFLAQPPGDPSRLFLGTREGFIRVFNMQTREFQPHYFLDIFEDVVATGEGGMLGMAFHPDFQTNGKFYVSLTADNGGVTVVPAEEEFPAVLSPFSVTVREYSVSSDPTRADLASKRSIIEWVKPYDVHNGGWIGFSPHDGNLYISTGDGGGFYDNAPGHNLDVGNAQDLTNNLMGKILRINVNGDDFANNPNRNYAIPPDNPFVGIPGDNEIFANGLRNPWRASFDRATGDFWIGDVGEGTREEINVIPAGSGGGQNFGWRLREGSDRTPDLVGGPPPARNAEPMYDYAHFGLGGEPTLQGNSVVGGFVYRGPDPELNGQYVFADFIASRFWMFDPSDPYGTIQNITSQLLPTTGSISLITTFFEDSIGNLYVGTLTGDVFQLNTNAWTPGDFQHDGLVDARDVPFWRQHFGLNGVASDYSGNADGDADVDGMDFLLWQRNVGHNPLTLTIDPPSGAGVPEPHGAVLVAVLTVSVVAEARRRETLTYSERDAEPKLV